MAEPLRARDAVEAPDWWCAPGIEAPIITP